MIASGGSIMSETPVSGDVRRGVRLWVVKALASLPVMGMLLFGAAGRLDWAAGWIYLGTVTACTAMAIGLLVPRCPELLAERSKLQPGTKPWDKYLASLVALAGPMGMVVAAGLDTRFHGPTMPSRYLQPALIVTFVSWWLTLWAMLSNRFFSSTVRIQSERGHVVEDRGPYRYVRHPGYAGIMPINMMGPLILGSDWCWPFVALVCAALVVRTYLEDRTLQAELPGYAEYATRVKWRLVPGVW
jgi:protein-S-isoprenylcysteine O-methyltransferase Ste14